MKVFISHTSKDKPSVEALAHALRERGIEPWFDGWESVSGDDIVAKRLAPVDEPKITALEELLRRPG